MEKPIYKRQDNKQIAIINMTPIIKDILESYHSETFGTMATKIGVSVGTIKTWYRRGKARKKEADALITAYPISSIVATSELEYRLPINQTTTLTELFDQVFQGLSEIRQRLGA